MGRSRLWVINGRDSLSIFQLQRIFAFSGAGHHAHELRLRNPALKDWLPSPSPYSYQSIVELDILWLIICVEGLEGRRGEQAGSSLKSLVIRINPASYAAQKSTCQQRR